jgi:hypothetical protein
MILIIKAACDFFSEATRADAQVAPRAAGCVSELDACKQRRPSLAPAQPTTNPPLFLRPSRPPPFKPFCTLRNDPLLGEPKARHTHTAPRPPRFLRTRLNDTQKLRAPAPAGCNQGNGRSHAPRRAPHRPGFLGLCGEGVRSAAARHSRLCSLLPSYPETRPALSLSCHAQGPARRLHPWKLRRCARATIAPYDRPAPGRDEKGGRGAENPGARARARVRAQQRRGLGGARVHHC